MNIQKNMLQMLSTVTFYCQVTMIVMIWQLSKFTSLQAAMTSGMAFLAK